MALDISGATDEQVTRFRREMDDSLRRITARMQAALDRAHRDGTGAIVGDAFNLALSREVGDQLSEDLGVVTTEAQAAYRLAAGELSALIGQDLEAQGISEQLGSVGQDTLATLLGHGLDDLAQL